MTTNQRIDGVPRAVIAAFAKIADHYSDAEADSFEPWQDALMHDELRLTLGQFRKLRALLDAPARTPLLGGGALEEQPEWAQIQILKNTVSDLQGDIEKLQADIAAQPQGEPVAWIDWSGGDCPVDVDAMVEYSMAGNPQQVCRPEFACRLDWHHDHRPTKRKSNIVKYRPIAEQPQGVQMACMPVERCYDVRAKMIIAFNEAKKAGGDLDDALDAAYKSALRYSPNPLSADPPAASV